MTPCPTSTGGQSKTQGVHPGEFSGGRAKNKLRAQRLAASASLPKPAHVTIHPHAYPLLYHALSSAPRLEACVVGIRSKQSPAGAKDCP